MITVVVADDHRLVREGIRALLERAHDIKVLGEADDGDQAVELVAELAPDALVMDITMPGTNGLEAAARLRESSPDTSVVILSMHSDPAMVRRAMDAGARGYVVKGAAAEELLLAVRAAKQGAIYLSPAVSAILNDPTEPTELLAQTDSLTSREKEVVGLIGDGMTNRAIAHQLGVSIKTVERHRSNLMAKLDVHSVVGLVRVGVKLGLIKLEDVE